MEGFVMQSIWLRTFLLVLVLTVTAGDARGQLSEAAMQGRVGLELQVPAITDPARDSFGRSVWPVNERTEQGSLALTVGGSVLLGTAAAFVGGLVGGAFSEGCDGFLCELEGVAIGFLVATPLGTAAGAHLGNGRRGNLGLDILAAAAGLGIAAVIWSADDWGLGVFIAGAVPAIGFPVFAERRSARQKARGRVQAVTLAPTRDGLAAAVSISL
jgi:hypothetical protein